MTSKRIEDKEAVEKFLTDLKYALAHRATLIFQEARMVDANRDIRHTNRFTVADLFPDEDTREVLSRELKSLTVKDYLRTVEDAKFPNRGEMREFGKVYDGGAEVYIKVRVELLNPLYGGKHTIFVMSFHYAETPFAQERFPYG